MGIYQDVWLEARARVHVSDVFCRVAGAECRVSSGECRVAGGVVACEAWIEVFNGGELREDISLELSVFGQNFNETVFENQKHEVEYAGPATNQYRIGFDLPDARVWSPETPWLYQIHVKVLDKEGRVLDAFSRQFGVRLFTMDEGSDQSSISNHQSSIPLGRMFLNGREIRLRGANTMGHLQQCVMRGDTDQLSDDILLARICNMNFLRITQRPVQSEIYDMCDRLGLMVQTDLPLFGVLRRNQFCEAVRQAGELERLIRSHPSCIMVSYINEPSPVVRPWKNLSQRHIQRDELEMFFEAADKVVRLNNPDRVIKAVDGDYDPPGPGLPDNHCYCGWYNGHGLDLGKLYAGYWQKVKPGWHYGCGEFGAEGLDPVTVMRKYYPEDWLPQTIEDEATWSPTRIARAQTGGFHAMWYEAAESLEGWVQASQAHQAWVVKLQTEAFRRDSRMNTIAIHLFIDAWPAGWMKTIMDVDRQPKHAYFAYRDALTPLMVNLRPERFKVTAGEDAALDVWVCNDTQGGPEQPMLKYVVESAEGEVLFSGHTDAAVPICGSAFQGKLRFRAPAVEQRMVLTVRLALTDDATGEVVHYSEAQIEVFPASMEALSGPIHLIVDDENDLSSLLEELGVDQSGLTDLNQAEIILIADMAGFETQREAIEQAVRGGARAIFLELPEGSYEIANTEVVATPCGRGAMHFVSCKTGHPLVESLEPDDFFFWHSVEKGYPAPLISATFMAEGWETVLRTTNCDCTVIPSVWREEMAAAERKDGQGLWRICQLHLNKQAAGNPVAQRFAVCFLTK